jgi:type II secretory pathway pseudopilin PulG
MEGRSTQMSIVPSICSIRRRTVHRAFTLLESLMAAGILLGIVIAVTSAVTAGQQNAWEAQRLIAGTIAAEELMGRLSTEDYDALSTWNGYSEAVGTMTDAQGAAFPESFDPVGRQVSVATELQTYAGLGVIIRGKKVTVQSLGADSEVLCTITRFFPEPSSS